MKAYKKIMGGIAEFEKIVLSVILVFVTVITFANVVVRKLSDSPFAWTEDLVINLFVLLIMMGWVFVAISTVANTVLWVLLLKTGIDKVLSQLHSGKLTSSLGWPEWMFTIFLPIGAVFLVLHTIEFCVDVMADNAPCVREEGGND